jgi:energy-coupling factor transport system ATP-binding protein
MVMFTHRLGVGFMFIKSKKVTYDYHVHNELGEVEMTHRALDGVELNIEKGKFIAILGHNGSGKSTFAKHINALLLPTEGTLYVKEMDTKDDAKLWDIRSSAGMVFQNPDNQIIATIVEEDVAFGPENLGVPSETIVFNVEKALSTVDMTSYAKHSPNKLSGGQKQRVAIAGVLAMHPECIILDEPTAMLDPSGRKEVLDTVHFLNKKEGITILLITHYMEEAIDADYIYVMEKGKVAFEGSPVEVFSEIDKMKAAGLDVPQTVELAHYLKQHGVAIDTDLLHINEMVEKLWELKLKI